MLGNSENKKLRNKSFSNAATNKSTLSLHISAYENSIEDTSAVRLDLFDDKISKKKSFIVSSLTVQNPFEFLRQQESNEEANKPEISQFKASQRLANPNVTTSTTNNVSNDENSDQRLSARIQNNVVEQINDNSNPQLQPPIDDNALVSFARKFKE
uniref:Uncharacterized protein n=1 Tax=Panagrolaimus sp. PS1159 TaxID=55785 RepID=A0AC35G496_9BILA